MLQNPIVQSGRRRRAWPYFVVAGLVVVAGAVAGIVIATRHSSSERTLARRYVAAWQRDDYAAMYGMLDAASRGRVSERAFAHAYRSAAITATLQSVRPVSVGALQAGRVRVLVAAQTRLFGALREPLDLPITGPGSTPRVHFEDALVFPGLRAGERLGRRMALPPRAALLAADGTPLAEGPRRHSPIASIAAGIVGTLGPISSAQRIAYEAQGYPPHAKVGLDGLERIFEPQLAGTPGGTLRAGARVLAARAPRPGQPVTTTIDPHVEAAINAALGARYGGMVALDPRTGAMLGAAGIAFSGLQPPGSTMKIVTTTGVLEAGIASPHQDFPVQTAASVGGYVLHNANGEACGGTLINAFAVSCNSVFAPLGVKLGSARFLAVAQRFGFNAPSPIPGEPASTIPPASVQGNATALGESAIGQGRVQATALQMADVAATIAMGGRRPMVTLRAGGAPHFVTVTTPAVAREVQEMMIAVIDQPNGTGAPARLPGVQIAGKTGTAELRSTSNPNTSSPTNTDSWFVGYGPVGDPRIVVGALFPNQGAGAATAAPAVRQVLAAALGH